VDHPQGPRRGTKHSTQGGESGVGEQQVFEIITFHQAWHAEVGNGFFATGLHKQGLGSVQLNREHTRVTRPQFWLAQAS